MVEHLVSPMKMVLPDDVGPKFVPIRVTVAPDVVGTFGTCNRVIDGASYVKLRASVPAKAETVTVLLLVPDPAGAMQAMLVSDAQVVLAQALGGMPAVRLTSDTPKLFPKRVKYPPPVVGLFVIIACETAGAS